MAIQQKKYKRAQYIVDKKMQFRFVGLMLFYIFIFFLFSISVIYFSGWKQLIEKMAYVYPQARLAEILNVVYLKLFVGFLILLPVAIISAIFASHQIAGPLVRIKRALLEMINGDYNLSLTLRKHDRLKDVADQINKLADSLKKKNAGK